MTYVGLHNHSDYSLLDGASQIPQMVAKATELGMPAIALTDHGVMYGAIELLKQTKGTPVKPIVGNEMYILGGNGDYTVQDEKNKKRPKYHQIILAKNFKGYQNLVKLTTISNLEGFQGKGVFARPCINKETLAQYREGLIVTSACLGGEIPQAIMQKKPEIALSVARWYQEVFGEDYYIELQDHGSHEDRVVNVALVRIARELGIKIISTNDSHFISCLDVEAHDALLCMMTGKQVSEDKRLRYSGTEYIKSRQEMSELFLDHLDPDVIEESLDTTLEIMNKIEDYRDELFGTKEKPVNHVPSFPVPEGYTAATYLVHLAHQGLKERFPNGLPDEVVYMERMEEELTVIQEMNFPDYFLVVWDYINYANQHGIPTGPGRGSAAGSLVSYALRITNIDPVEHGLLFERFLNKFRISMPDVDTDFCPRRREEVIKYVTEKYGEDRVCQIVTFNRMTSKAVLKDVGRVLNIPYFDTDRMSKMVPVQYGKPEKLTILIAEDSPVPEFRDYYAKGGEGKRWIDLAIQISGTNKSTGVHAAGVIISGVPLDLLVPRERSKEGVIFAQYSMEDIEKIGLLKMDFLGLKNLTIIQDTLDLIEKEGHPIPDVQNLNMLDPKTYQLMGRGQLEGVFQLESSGMKATVASLKPENIEDISAILALYRPGPLSAGMVPSFINRKHGREDVSYDHPLLEPILKDTYGVIVYQEAVMKISVALAGYSLYDADSLRKIVGKKRVEEMIPERAKFLAGCDTNGVDRSISEKVWTQIETFGSYGFNKSHSLAYAGITYQTAYLKAHYPAQYMSALLTSNADKIESVQKYLAACHQMNLNIALPDINQSDIHFTPEGNRILFGLSAIKGLGEATIEAILVSRRAEGKFASMADLCDRVSMNKKSLEALIQSGAFDSIHPNRKAQEASIERTLLWAKNRSKDRFSGQTNLLTMMEEDSGVSGYEFAPEAPKISDYDPIEKLRREKEVLGFYVSDHPLKNTLPLQKRMALLQLANASDKSPNEFVSSAVMITEIRRVVSKKTSEWMAILTIEDLSGTLSAVVFPKQYAKISECLQEDARIFVQGTITYRDEQPQMIIDHAVPLDRAEAVCIRLTTEQASDFWIKNKIREGLILHRGKKYEGVVPVVAEVVGDNKTIHVSFGREAWVTDATAAAQEIQKSGFSASTFKFIP